MKKFFTSMEWWKLVPDQSVIAAPVWGGRAAAAISEDGDFAVVYYTSRFELPIDIGRVGNSGPVNAIWIDPAAGKTVSETTVGGGEYKFTSPPCCDDAVLLLKRAC